MAARSPRSMVFAQRTTRWFEAARAALRPHGVTIALQRVAIVVRTKIILTFVVGPAIENLLSTFE